MIITKRVQFNSTKEQIWDLLTNPKMTKRYMFGCEVLSNWTVGSPIIWKAETDEGQYITYVKGEIKEILHGTKVKFSMIPLNTGIKDISENYVDLTYELTELEPGTLLKLIQGDYKGVENSKERYEESIKGWDMVIPIMKDLIDSVNN